MLKTSVSNRKKLIVIITLLVIIISVIGFNYINRYLDYSKANELYENGNYDEALLRFKSLEDFNNSEEMILEVNYSKANNLLNQKEFDKAIEIFSTLKDYSDSKDMVNKSIYLKAKEFAFTKHWVKAIDTLSLIPEYENSNDLIRDYRYNYGIEKGNNKEWESAISIMESLDNYSRSEELIKRYNYQLALEKGFSGDWNSAKEIMFSIKGYEDSEKLFYQYDINNKLNLTNLILFEENEIKKAPISVEDFIDIFLYMFKTDKLEYTIYYEKALDEGVLEQIEINLTEAYSIVNSQYVENFIFLHGGISYYTNDSTSPTALTLILANDNPYKTLSKQSKFELESYKLINTFIDEGKLTADMSEKEKAKFLYIWIAQNLEYDEDFYEDSFTGYGAIINRKAVCNGYTSLYNRLCKILGINVIGVIGNVDYTDDMHIWTYANLDGEKVYIDATWGDPNDDKDWTYDMSYFAVSDKTLSRSHSWDRESIIFDW